MNICRFNLFSFSPAQERLILIACAGTMFGLNLALLVLAADLLISHLVASMT